MAEEDQEETETEDKKSGGMMQKLTTAVGLFVLVLAAQIVAPFINNAIHGSPETATDEEVEEGEPAEEELPEDLPPAIYTPLDPPLVINFEAPGGATRFLQLSLQGMARDQATIDAIKNHAPAIRNNFLFLISNSDYDQLGTLEGKEKLRTALLTETQDILRRNGSPADVEAVYFTSFVMQ